MKNRKPSKPRCLVTKAMRESKLFAPKSIPNKKGKGVIYNRAKQDRSDLSGPFFVGADQALARCCARSSFKLAKNSSASLTTAILVLTDEGREAIRSGT